MYVFFYEHGVFQKAKECLKALGTNDVTDPSNDLGKKRNVDTYM